MTPALPEARELLELLAARGWSIATAESLTGGLLSSAIVDVAGASAHMRGGVVAYDTRAKRELLGVDAGLLDEHGPVHPEVARQMAGGVRRALRLDGADAEVGLSTTGIAGPVSPDGQPVGTVYVGVSTSEGDRVDHAVIDGDRDRVRHETVRLALRLAITALRDGVRE